MGIFLQFLHHVRDLFSDGPAYDVPGRLLLEQTDDVINVVEEVEHLPFVSVIPSNFVHPRVSLITLNGFVPNTFETLRI